MNAEERKALMRAYSAVRGLLVLSAVPTNRRRIVKNKVLKFEFLKNELGWRND
jgi:hypothetical protein